MLESTVYSLGDPGTFDITDKTDPMYYIARNAHEWSENLYNLQTQGFKFKQIEASDIDSAEEAYDTWATSIETWFATAVAESEAGSPISSVPAIPDITNILPWIAGNPLLMVLAKIAIQILLAWIRKKLDPDTSAKEISQVLKQGLIGEDGEGDEYALLYLAFHQALQIILSKEGDFSEYLYSSES